MAHWNSQILSVWVAHRICFKHRTNLKNGLHVIEMGWDAGDCNYEIVGEIWLPYPQLRGGHCCCSEELLQGSRELSRRFAVCELG